MVCNRDTKMFDAPYSEDPRTWQSMPYHISEALPDYRYADREHREELAREKLKFMTARQRIGLRVFLSSNTSGPEKWAKYLYNETVILLTHIGYCYLMGYSTEVPYYLRDLAEQIHGFSHEEPSWGIFAHAAINTDFSDSQDRELLRLAGKAGEATAWWDKPQEDFVIDLFLIDEAFSSYINNITNNKVHENTDSSDRVSGGSQFHQAMMRLLQQASAAEILKDTTETIPTDSHEHVPLVDIPAIKRVLVETVHRISKAEMEVESALTVVREGIHRSQFRIGAYEALQKMYKEVDDPFPNDRIHERYKNVYPPQPSYVDFAAHSFSHSFHYSALTGNGDAPESMTNAKGVKGEGDHAIHNLTLAIGDKSADDIKGKMNEPSSTGTFESANEIIEISSSTTNTPGRDKEIAEMI